VRRHRELSGPGESGTCGRGSIVGLYNRRQVDAAERVAGSNFSEDKLFATLDQPPATASADNQNVLLTDTFGSFGNCASAVEAFKDLRKW